MDSGHLAAVLQWTGSLTASCCRRRLHKRGSYMPPIRWYADTALAVGLRHAVPERLRFFIAGDNTPAIREFEVRLLLHLRRMPLRRISSVDSCTLGKV